MSLEQAKEVLRVEAQGVLALIDRLDQDFEKAVDLILDCAGRTVVTGMGKSGLIGRKIVATMNSTGTPALFLHPAEGLHGDLGMVSPGDVVLALSNSGETDELLAILPAIRGLGAKVIALVGKTDSSLALLADLVLDAGVAKEACPLGLAPTSSTTAALALGDALSVCLLTKRGFNEADFKVRHPGGKLGERLSLKVREVMISGDELPLSGPGAAMVATLAEMDSKNQGHAIIIDDELHLLGIIADGDLRRALTKGEKITPRTAEEMMIPNPKSIDPEAMALDALELMENHQITALPVVEGDKVVGLIHLHDILGRGRLSFRANS